MTQCLDKHTNKSYCYFVSNINTDCILSLSCMEQKIELPCHKNILARSEYFNILFSYGEKNEYVVEVFDLHIAYDVIMSLYTDIDTRDKDIFDTAYDYIVSLSNIIGKRFINSFNRPEWKHILETHKCKNYFLLDNDITELYDLIVPKQGFELLLDVLSNYDIIQNRKLIKLIKNNIPFGYDMSKLSDPLRDIIKKDMQIISCGPLNTIDVYDIDSNQLVNRLSKDLIHSNKTSSVVVSRDNTLIVTGHIDGFVKIWDAKNYKNIQTIHHPARVLCVAISNDNTFVISGGDFGAIKVWDINGMLLRELIGHNDWVQNVVVSSDNKLIVSISWDCTIKIWNSSTGQLIRTFVVCENSLCDQCHVAISNDSKYVVSSGFYTISIWETDSGKLVDTISVDKYESKTYTCVSISNNNKYIVAGDTDKKIKIWEISQPTCILLHTLIGHKDRINAISISNDSTVIASASDDETVSAWRMNDGELITTLNIGYAVYSVAILE